MTNKEEDLISLLMRKYTNMRAEFMILMGIAVRSQSQGEPVRDLSQQLETGLQSPYHLEQKQVTEQLLAAFRHSIDEDALIQWIEDKPQGKLPN